MSNLELNRIKAFGMTNHMILADLTQIENEYSISLGHLSELKGQIEDSYYPQFNASIRATAFQMSHHYELFYCLEWSIRELVAQALEEAENSAEWWQTPRIPQQITQDVSTRIQREVDTGFSRRSDAELDYTTFGELAQIITSNWDIFGSIFSSKKAVERVMASLNTLRNPIAHCSILAEDEILRLNLAVRDWFRLME
ncbi:MAG: hypothetical protein EOM54_01660 [Clostridia bacterium]|nr:hypothetical protein [Clostridia bacterium]